MDFKNFWNIKHSQGSHLLPIIPFPSFLPLLYRNSCQSISKPNPDHQFLSSVHLNPPSPLSEPLSVRCEWWSSSLGRVSLLPSLIHPKSPLPLSESLSVRWWCGSGSFGWVGPSLVLTPPVSPSPLSESLSVRCGGGLVPFRIGLSDLYLWDSPYH